MAFPANPPPLPQRPQAPQQKPSAPQPTPGAAPPTFSGGSHQVSLRDGMARADRAFSGLPEHMRTLARGVAEGHLLARDDPTSRNITTKEWHEVADVIEKTPGLGKDVANRFRRAQ